MKKIFIFLLTILSIFVFWTNTVSAANFWKCRTINGPECDSVGYFGSQTDCEWYYSVPCYTTSNCDGKCGNQGSAGSGTTTQIPHYYCQDYVSSGVNMQRCAYAGTYLSTALCQSDIGKTCYTTDYCDNKCYERSKTTYYYCDSQLGTCQLAGGYYSDYECSLAHSGKACYVATDCNRQCEASSKTQYWQCTASADSGCGPAGRYGSTEECEKNHGVGNCFTSSNCYNKCGQSFYVCGASPGTCVPTPRYNSLSACNANYLGYKCYTSSNCDNDCPKQMYYCFGNICNKTEKAYKTTSECAYDIQKPACYIDSSCNLSCSASTGCNNNGICETSRNETSVNCPNDCGCDYDKVCESSRGENSTNCTDCAGGGGSTTGCDNDGFCEPAQGENSTNCSDCQTTTGCNYNNICESSRGEDSTNCSDCQTTTPPVADTSGYVCNSSTKTCEWRSSGGTYAYLSTCNAVCNTTSVKYSCDSSTGYCYQSTSGYYTNANTCVANCSKNSGGYNCNSLTGGCYAVSSFAQYSNLSACSLNCSAPSGIISVQTLNPTNLTQNSARFNGNITNRGGYTNFEGWFRYYKKSDGIWQATGIVYINSLINTFYFDQSGLEPNTEYCYLAVAQASGTTNRAQGQEVCFVTSGSVSDTGYNCINGTCVIGGIGELTDYPDASSCSVFCKSGGGWNCNIDGTCSPTTGSADYSAENACVAYCEPQPRGYNCVAGQCLYSYSFITDYPDLSSCSANCQTGSGYDCQADGTCSPVTNDPDYGTQGACTQYCQSAVTGYNCISGECNLTYDYVADYPDQQSCSANCADGSGWICNTDGTCSGVSDNAHYSTEQSCNDNCDNINPTGYNCVLGSCQASYDAFADYPNQSVCSAHCGANARWTCSIGGVCSPVALGGEYDTQAVCGQYCSAHEETIIARTDQASSVTQDSARLNGTLVDNGGRADLEYFFRYQEQGSSSWLETFVFPISSEGSMFANVSGLEANTEYCYYVVVRIVGQGTEHRGETVCFTTNPLANLGIPILIHPIDDEVETNTLINFDWTDVSGAQIYEIWERFGDDVGTESIFYANESQIQAQITEIGRHYWRARACIDVNNIRQNPTGPGIIFDGTPNCGQWSETETFIIANNQGINCVYNADGINAVLPIDISACSFNTTFIDGITSATINPNDRLRVGDVVIMDIGDLSSDWTVGDASTIRHPIAWIANAQSAYSSRTPINSALTYPYPIPGTLSLAMVGVAATNPLIQDPDIVITTISNNLEISRLEYGRYRIRVLSEGTGNIDLNINDIFSYATANGEVCGQGFVPGCSRSYAFTLQGTIPEEDVPGNGTTTTSTVPDGSGSIITTSTCVEVSINDGEKTITRKDDDECSGEINAVIYDVGRDEILDRTAVLRIENYHDDGTGTNNPPRVVNLRNNNPDWCLSTSIRLEWDYEDPDNNPQGKYKIDIYDDKNNLIESETVESASTAYSFSLVNRYNQEFYWEVEVWDANQNSLNARSERVKMLGIPKHQYPTSLFSHNEVQIGSDDIEYKIWFSDQSTAYDSNIKKYEWDFDGDGNWDKVFDSAEEIQSMRDHPETQLLYVYDPDNYTETVLRVTDEDSYSCEYIKNVIPEDFKYEDYSPVDLNR